MKKSIVTLALLLVSQSVMSQTQLPTITPEQAGHEVAEQAAATLVKQVQTYEGFARHVSPRYSQVDRNFFAKTLKGPGKYPKLTISGRTLTSTLGSSRVVMQLPEEWGGDLLIDGKSWKPTAGFSVQQEVLKLAQESGKGKEVSFLDLVIPKAEAGFLPDPGFVASLTLMLPIGQIYNEAIAPRITGFLCRTGWKPKDKCEAENPCLRNQGQNLILFENDPTTGKRIRYQADFSPTTGRLTRYDVTPVDEHDMAVGATTEVYFSDDNKLTRMRTAAFVSQGVSQSPTRVIEARTKKPLELKEIEERENLATLIRSWRITCQQRQVVGQQGGTSPQAPGALVPRPGPPNGGATAPARR